jgi:hypothetical protein
VATFPVLAAKNCRQAASEIGPGSRIRGNSGPSTRKDTSMEAFKTTRSKIVYGLVVTVAWGLFFYFNVYSKLPDILKEARANSGIIYDR